MNTKKIYLLLAVVLLLTACSKDWTKPYPNDITGIGTDKNPKTTNPEGYYEALRAFKKTDHEVSFGWFGNWTGVGSSLNSSMAGLPDSTDFISMWGGWKNPSAEQLADLRFVQKTKGIKAMACFLVLEIGDQLTPPMPKEEEDKKLTWSEWKHKYWGWKDGDDASIKASIVKFANAICDTIDKYDYDGFDMDAEPNYPHPFPTNYELWRGNGDYRIRTFIETMSKRIGPRSGTGKMFVIDGEPYAIPPDLADCFDYYIVQAYAARNDANLDSRLQNVISAFSANKKLTPEYIASRFIVTENFESYAQQGGVSYTDRYGNKMLSLEGMARWKPVINGKPVRKGGAGSFHMEYEYVVSGQQGTYPYLRKAIQVMNPPVLAK